MSGDKSRSRESLNHRDEEKVALKDAEADAAENDQMDPTKVQFVNGGTADARVDIEGKTKLAPEFTGLTKEELMKFADDPFWVKIRWVMLILFWVVWVAMLGAAIAIIIVAPKCPPRPKQDWWQKSSIYSVYPKSFKDTNDDGYGDLAGIHQNLDYFKSLNATVVSLGALTPSTGTDAGYEVTDYQNIDSIYGTMDEFDSLRVAMHKKGMKLVMDFVPNHSSKNHTWFKKSQKKEEGFEDYYIWMPNTGSLPNDWKNSAGEPAWTLDAERDEYYYHRFASSQPDLNLRNEDVKQEMKNILTFWMGHGVDGFRVKGAAYLVESSDTSANGGAEYQVESYELLTSWRELLDAQGEEDGKSKFLMVDSMGNVNQTAQFYTYEEMPGAHLVENRILYELTEGCNAKCVSDLVDRWMSDLGASGLPTSWETGNHYRSRVATRMNEEKFTDAINMLVLTLPGTSITYYGEEIGMHDVNNADAGTKYDKYRTPLQWSDAPNAGFTDGTPWLPVAGDYKERNIMTQRAHGAGVGNIEVYAEVSNLKSEPSFQWGEFKSMVKESVYYYTRQAEGFGGYLVALNFGSTSGTVDFTAGDMQVPQQGKIAASTHNFEPTARMAEFEVGHDVVLTSVHLKAGEGFIASWTADQTPPPNAA